MKNIAVMGLMGLENFGEQFLAKCVAYLIGDKYQVRYIDFEPPKKRFGEVMYGIVLVLAKLMPKKEFSHRLILQAVKIRSKRHFSKMLRGCDKLIFACGSYKYSTQKLWAYYSIAIEIAEEMNIPVMFDAMNIQDYSESDWRCACLKEHTNYSCVKVFTTRDGKQGLKKLHTDYLTNSKIVVSDVGDPAFWIPECYMVSKNSRTGKIGINLIRGSIFLDYGKQITEEQLEEFYCNLIRHFEASKLEWELFTNGLKGDYQFGKRVLAKCGMKNKMIQVSQTDKELVELIAGYQGIVGARLHACICAYALDIPMIGFIWDEKMLRFAEITGLTKWFLKEEELSGNNAFQIMQDALYSKYDDEIRNMWKEKTKSSIQDFLVQDYGCECVKEKL